MTITAEAAGGLVLNVSPRHSISLSRLAAPPRRPAPPHSRQPQGSIDMDSILRRRAKAQAFMSERAKLKLPVRHGTTTPEAPGRRRR